MSWVAEAFHWLVTSRYTLALEREVDYLRRENHAMRDSLLGVAGVPALEPKIRAQANGDPSTVRGFEQPRVVRRPTMHSWLRQKELAEARRRAARVKQEQEELLEEVRTIQHGNAT